MTDIERIKAEIERRIKKYGDSVDKKQSECDAWKWAECRSILSFIDSLPAESKHPRLRNKESWISKAKREKSFLEYLRGVFETNNGVENDPDLLIALHGQTLFELAQKESADGEGEVVEVVVVDDWQYGKDMDGAKPAIKVRNPDWKIGDKKLVIILK